MAETGQAVKPLVSICIPAFNAGKYISETVASLIKQTYKQIEIIVVDDGSADDTLQKLKAIKDPRLVYYSIENAGASAARNTAYRFSHGTYVKFMDADDLLSENCVEEQVNAILANEHSIASAKWGRFCEPDLSDFQLVPEKNWVTLAGPDWLVESLIDYGRNMTQPGIFLIPRQLIEKAGLWDESLSLIDDFDFMTRIIAISQEVVFCQQAVLYYRSGITTSLSRQSSRPHMVSAFLAQLKGIKAILNKRDDARAKLACANSLQSWAYEFYPAHMDLFTGLDSEIKKLGGAFLPVEGGFFYRLIVRILGWKAGKRIKLSIKKRKIV